MMKKTMRTGSMLCFLCKHCRSFDMELNVECGKLGRVKLKFFCDHYEPWEGETVAQASK